MDLLLYNLPWENNQICLDLSLTSALVQFNFNKLNKIDYDDDLNSKQVPKMHVLLREIDVKFRRVLLRHFSGVDEDLQPDKRQKRKNPKS